MYEFFLFLIVKHKAIVYGMVYVPAKSIAIMGIIISRKLSAIPMLAIEIIEPNILIKEIGIGNA